MMPMAIAGDQSISVIDEEDEDMESQQQQSKSLVIRKEGGPLAHLEEEEKEHGATS